MTDHFEAWINGMTEEQYTDWLEDEATEAQEDKALNIRTPLSEGELSEMEREQEFIPTSEIIEVEQPRKQPTIVYDNRDMPIFRVPAIIVKEPEKTPVVIPITKEPIVQQSTPAIIANKSIPSAKVRESIFRRFINIFRRKK